MKKSLLVALILAMIPAGLAQAGEQTAIFAGGCFWCMEKDFDAVAGVKEVVSGYTGGTIENPTYRNHDGHVEAVRITFDDSVVGYERLLEIFWRSVDPTDADGQFCDRGHSYTTAVFAVDAAQLELATASKAQVDGSGKLKAAVVTPVLGATPFTLAEDYHQDYHKKNPGRYGYYRWACGRDARIQALWGDEAHGGIKHEG